MRWGKIITVGGNRQFVRNLQIGVKTKTLAGLVVSAAAKQVNRQVDTFQLPTNGLPECAPWPTERLTSARRRRFTLWRPRLQGIERQLARLWSPLRTH